jgi:hypothetical protein
VPVRADRQGGGESHGVADRRSDTADPLQLLQSDWSELDYIVKCPQPRILAVSVGSGAAA